LLSEHATSEKDIAENLERIGKTTSSTHGHISELFSVAFYMELG